MKKRIFTFLSGLIISACSFSVLPGQEKKFEDFLVPVGSSSGVSQETSPTQNFDQTNFPFHCDWKTLERVIDGDTIVVQENTHVRLIGIDTPETKDPRKPIQPFGLEASEKIKEFLKNSEKVCLMQDNVSDKIDTYGRTLAYIFTETGTDVNAELLKSGLARAYLYFPFSRKAEFSAYEKQAKTAHLNLWQK